MVLAAASRVFSSMASSDSKSSGAFAVRVRDARGKRCQPSSNGSTRLTMAVRHMEAPEDIPETVSSSRVDRSTCSSRTMISTSTSPMTYGYPFVVPSAGGVAPLDGTIFNPVRDSEPVRDTVAVRELVADLSPLPRTDCFRVVMAPYTIAKKMFGDSRKRIPPLDGHGDTRPARSWRVSP